MALNFINAEYFNSGLWNFFLKHCLSYSSFYASSTFSFRFECVFCAKIQQLTG